MHLKIRRRDKTEHVSGVGTTVSVSILLFHPPLAVMYYIRYLSPVNQTVRSAHQVRAASLEIVVPKAPKCKDVL